MRALVWGLIISLWAGWSFAAWLAHAVVTWSGWRAPDLSGWSERAALFVPPDWMRAWIPQSLVDAVKAGLVAWGPRVHEALQSLPDFSPWLGLLVWSAWTAGTALLAGVGLLILMLLRNSPAKDGS